MVFETVLPEIVSALSVTVSAHTRHQVAVTAWYLHKSVVAAIESDFDSAGRSHKLQVTARDEDADASIQGVRRQLDLAINLEVASTRQRIALSRRPAYDLDSRKVSCVGAV